MATIINTRADLDALRSTPKYLEALRLIAGAMDTEMNSAEPDAEPVWERVETLETIHRFGFATRAEFDAEYAAATAESVAG